MNESKACKTCGETKPLTGFYFNRNMCSYSPYCKPCQIAKSTQWARDNRGRMREIRAIWDKRNPNYNKQNLQKPDVKARRIPYQRRAKLKIYGLVEVDYQKLFEQQQGQCCICEKPLTLHGRNTHIDHCHSSGKVRGILCMNCNQGLGSFKDSRVLLESAIDYLTEW